MSNKCVLCGSTHLVNYTVPPFTGKCCFSCYNKSQYFNGNEITVENNSINNKCSKCGDCCTDFIPMTDEEIRIIKFYIKKYNIEPSIVKDMNGNTYIACPFISEKGCKIYPVRPAICKDFACWKSDKVLYKNKIKNTCRACVNDLPTKYKSLHEIFFDNKEYSNYLIKNIAERNFKQE